MKTVEKRIEEKLQTIVDICDAIMTEEIDGIEEAKYLLKEDMVDIKNKMVVMAFLFANEETRVMNDYDDSHVFYDVPNWYKVYSIAREKQVGAEVFLEMYIESHA